MSSASHHWITAEPVASLHVEASTDAEVVSQSLYGWPVELLEEQGDWARVRTADAYKGWALRRQFLPPPAESHGVMQVSGLTANLYAEPDVRLRQPLMNLPWEARLTPVGGRGEDDGATWLRVRLLDGREAYVQRGDVMWPAPPMDVQRMLALAHRFLGITYTWGGTSAYGFDCSGFVQMLFRQIGVTLPRDAQAQSVWDGFTDVALDHVIAGDVVFFGDDPMRVTHVGVALGEGSFLHDTTEAHPGIQISRLGDMPWRERLTRQRRLLR